jgi:penicillin amidase
MADGPSYRQIVDLAEPSRSRFVHTTGQSGNVFSTGYRNFLPLWREGRDLPMAAGPPASTLTLRPGR